MINVQFALVPGKYAQLFETQEYLHVVLRHTSLAYNAHLVVV